MATANFLDIICKASWYDWRSVHDAPRLVEFDQQHIVEKYGSGFLNVIKDQTVGILWFFLKGIYTDTMAGLLWKREAEDVQFKKKTREHTHIRYWNVCTCIESSGLFSWVYVDDRRVVKMQSLKNMWKILKKWALQSPRH